MARDAGEINETSSTSFSIGAKFTLNIGLKTGNIPDLAGPGGEFGALIPITPIPGTVIPNPFGPAVGGAVTANNDGLNGVEIDIGRGFSIFANGTVTAVYSLRRGFVGFSGK